MLRKLFLILGLTVGARLSLTQAFVANVPHRSTTSAMRRASVMRRPSNNDMFAGVVAVVGQKFGQSTSRLWADDTNNNNESNAIVSRATPLDRPLLAAVDAAALLGFCAVGKASHNPADGMLDVAAVFYTALPFLLAWFVTSPWTGVYRPTTRSSSSSSDDTNNLVTTTLAQVAPGWAVAVPLGCALRGLVKGYIPPTSFIVVTLMATLILLTVARLVFAIVEDFFVELVN